MERVWTGMRKEGKVEGEGKGREMIGEVKGEGRGEGNEGRGVDGMMGGKEKAGVGGGEVRRGRNRERKEEGGSE